MMVYLGKVESTIPIQSSPLIGLILPVIPAQYWKSFGDIVDYDFAGKEDAKNPSVQISLSLSLAIISIRKIAIIWKTIFIVIYFCLHNGPLPKSP